MFVIISNYQENCVKFDQQAVRPSIPVGDNFWLFRSNLVGPSGRQVLHCSTVC